MSFIAPILKYVIGFTVTGFTTKTQNSDEFNEKTAKLASLWQQFSASDGAVNANIFSVYSDYESDANGLYRVTIGIASDFPPAQSSAVKIQTGNYLVFEGKGPLPTTVIETWQRVWNYFESESEYQRNFMSDFEAYGNADEVAIYIGVK